MTKNKQQREFLFLELKDLYDMIDREVDSIKPALKEIVRRAYQHGNLHHHHHHHHGVVNNSSSGDTQ
jgi:hypothetical protein